MDRDNAIEGSVLIRVDDQSIHASDMRLSLANSKGKGGGNECGLQRGVLIGLSTGSSKPGFLRAGTFSDPHHHEANISRESHGSHPEHKPDLKSITTFLSRSL